MNRSLYSSIFRSTHAVLSSVSSPSQLSHSIPMRSGQAHKQFFIDHNLYYMANCNFIIIFLASTGFESQMFPGVISSFQACIRFAPGCPELAANHRKCHQLDPVSFIRLTQGALYNLSMNLSTRNCSVTRVNLKPKTSKASPLPPHLIYNICSCYCSPKQLDSDFGTFSSV